MTDAFNAEVQQLTQHDVKALAAALVRKLKANEASQEEAESGMWDELEDKTMIPLQLLFPVEYIQWNTFMDIIEDLLSDATILSKDIKDQIFEHIWRADEECVSKFGAEIHTLEYALKIADKMERWQKDNPRTN
ncbi:hypothetical protein H6F93_11335 [Leptolyngbya sp. FACHB-671]|uniref:hypothetical protein n=1 Tax=Leptolyngbya sp. FACHB-671 TaxID=2692812 RepID=UPI001689BD13|nr:hypothetical protein [Leptolyngbya sp. FACHB-671]MBD2068109.1 hypothetical protein [Leptolyngbya sp. FACHB-671]